MELGLLVASFLAFLWEALNKKNPSPFNGKGFFL
jgi:hypothetical protein